MKIIVFEQNGSGTKKIQGIKQYGRNLEILAVHSINSDLPEFIDNPEFYIISEFTADLVLNFLKHPDLSEYLAIICRDKNIPVITSGQKIKNGITPFTCCGLGRRKGLGEYGNQFGFPEFELEVKENRVSQIKVTRGAPCGATWQVLSKIIGLTVEEAIPTIAREVQYICVADPSNFDPISGKSPLHYAGDVHTAAFNKALNKK